jgi:4-amino-4-deoxy-L-arabinose transferase-like glycosyltransferase
MKRTVALVLVFIVAMRLAVSGVIPTWAAIILVTAPAIALFWRDRLLLVGTLIGLPCLGASGLTDPWETHYAEVAREMIVRRDFISPWWANEGWFMTKPVLTFWLEALSMLLFGAKAGPDQVLAGSAHPEWAIRFPHFAIALAGAWLLGDGVSRALGKRAGFLSALVLWTMAGFALLSHQAMTDMPLVGGVAAALGLLLRALTTHDGETHPKAGLFLAIGIAFLIVPQLLAIVFSHPFTAGDPNTCGLPSQPPCAASALAHPRLRPLLQVSIWLVPTAWIALRISDEKRVARLCAIGAWAFAAFATMAKGPAGLVVPAAGVLVVVATRRDLRELLRLEIVAGLALAVAMIGPWYLAIYARHGRGFLDELVMRHMLGRTLDHLHDTNEGEDVGIVYFIRQLGYATFPWCGLAPFAFIASVRGRRHEIARALMFGAVLASFVLVSSMRTKFHHYMLVASPPLAALVGMWLADLPKRVRDAWTFAIVGAGGVIVVLVGRDLLASPARFIWLLTYRYARTWPSSSSFAVAFAIIAGGAALATAAVAIPRVRAYAIGGVALLSTAMLLDAYLPRVASDGGQRELLDAFYKDRGESTEPLVAYQLNWKGENFYTGGRVAIFITSGAPFQTYLDRERKKGEHTFYFATERGRLEGLRRELPTPLSFNELAHCAEFTLVRATY